MLFLYLDKVFISKENTVDSVVIITINSVNSIGISIKLIEELLERGSIILRLFLNLYKIIIDVIVYDILARLINNLLYDIIYSKARLLVKSLDPSLHSIVKNGLAIR